MRKLYFSWVLLFPLLTFSQQEAKQITYGKERIGFWQHLPGSYNTDAHTIKYPLLIFLHGIGERGNGTSDLWKVNRIAVPHYISQGNPMKFQVNGKWFSFIVLSPQCPTKYGMWPNLYIDAMIDYAVKNLRVDRSRIYLGGLSMGGGGTWQYASATPANAKKLAAIATSSAPPTMTNGCTIANARLPLYAFQAKDDRTVNYSSIVNTINAINACKPAIRPIEKLWPSGGHNIYDRAWDVGHSWQTPNVYEWMLGYTRNDADTSSGEKEDAPPLKPSGNKAPRADAGEDLLIQAAWHYTPTLNGSRSKDADGWIKSVVWSKSYGPPCKIVSPNSLTTKLENLQPGKYFFRITVTDNDGATALDEMTLIVNAAPVVKITGPASIVLPNNYAMFNSSPSTDRGGWITNWKWTQLSGPAARTSSNTASLIRMYDLSQGNYAFRLTVTDNEGGVSSSDFRLQVKPRGWSDNIALAQNQLSLASIMDDSASAATGTFLPDGMLQIYPNPVTAAATLNLSSERTGRTTLAIHDISGRLIRTEYLDKDQEVQTKTLDVSGLKAGTYILSASVGAQVIATRQFIKQ